MSNKFTVGEIAANRPEALSVFQDLGIDFCCGGKKPLFTALAEKSVSEERFFALLDEEKSRRSEARRTDFTAMSPVVLTTYIEDTHHGYLRNTLPELDRLLHAVLRAHGKNHAELFEVYKLFGRLKADLEQHLIKEEQLLFPALSQENADGAQTKRLALEIVEEHEAAGELLEALRRATNGFAVPADACLSYERAYGLLVELTEDLHTHIHLENNILLKELAV